MSAFVTSEHRRFRCCGLWLIGIVALCASGCVNRRLTIRSNPPGALVEVNGRRIGTTPASMDFTYYGTYEIRLTKPGFETLVVQQPVAPPWYQIPPLDLVSDNLLPMQVTNRRDYSWNLTPLPPTAYDDHQLRTRGDDFRSQARTGP